jgi:membrane protease YdiL (CAAX protease family)
MSPPAELSTPIWLAIAECAIVFACPAVWMLVISRWWMGLPVIPYQPRRQVPWDGIHVLSTVVAQQIVLIVVAAEVIRRLPIIAVAKPDAAADASAEHPFVKMLLACHHNPWVFLVALLAAVVVAPVFEEFLFRLLLQGWLEKVQRRRRRAAAFLGRSMALGAGPILLSSLIFGAVHFQVAAPAPPPLVVAAGAIADAVVKLLVMAAVIILLRVYRGATALDLGWAPEKLAGDVGLGLLAFLAAAPPVYLLNGLCQAVLPAKIASAPLPLVFFGLVLGTLYFRTHRIVPSIVTHAAFNATALLTLWGT